MEKGNNMIYDVEKGTLALKISEVLVIYHCNLVMHHVLLHRYFGVSVIVKPAPSRNGFAWWSHFQKVNWNQSIKLIKHKSSSHLSPSSSLSLGCKSP